ncbi:MAG TPA: hypothetical protein DHW14_05825 [Clostridiales bacterium]|nr:hypothetical protein [Clostridiales bacterium]
MPGRLETKVEDVMSRDPVTVLPTDTLAQAMLKMTGRDLGRLPVVSPEDPKRPVGIITRSDVLRAYNRGLLERERAQASD